ncbi:CBS domain-containing protein [Myxococcaceae bacterium JPH2]|nr:CBS domain-containing protein [Myxococcaceae bacterium JPH2]
MQIVGELMTRPVVTLKETQNLAKADELLRLHRIRHLPVVRQGRLVGLVTHRDLLRAAAHHGPPTERPIWAADIMTRDVATVRPDTPLRDAVRLILSQKYGCLPVVDEDDALLGILTEADLVKYAQHLIDIQDRREMAASYDA